MSVQVVKPRIRGFICTSAHPVGCEKNVQEQIDHIKSVGTTEALQSQRACYWCVYGVRSRIAYRIEVALWRQVSWRVL